MTTSFDLSIPNYIIIITLNDNQNIELTDQQKGCAKISTDGKTIELPYTFRNRAFNDYNTLVKQLLESQISIKQRDFLNPSVELCLCVDN